MSPPPPSSKQQQHHPRGHPRSSEGHYGGQCHRQSIRRQAQVQSAPTTTTAHPPPAAAAAASSGGGGGDVSDAFDDDGLFRFEQGAAAEAAVAAPGEDRTDCGKRQ